MKNINLNNINVNNTKSHLEALLKQREEVAKKLSALDAEIKETKKLLATKEQVLKLQAEYAAKVAALKKEYDAKMQALIGEDITPDPKPESPKPQPKAPAKETAAPKTALTAKKAEEKKSVQAPAVKAEAKSAEAPKAAAPAPKKEVKIAKTTTATPSEKKVEARSVVKVTADNYQRVINGIDKAKATSTVVTAEFDGSKEQFMMLVKATVYAFQNGIGKIELTYHDDAAVAGLSEEIALLLKYAQQYGISVSIRESHRVQTKKATPAPKTAPAPKAKAQGTNSAKADNTATEEETSDAFRAWTLSQACVVDGDDEI